MSGDKNVLGEPLRVCGASPRAGFYRSGACETGPEDLGAHAVNCPQDRGTLGRWSLKPRGDVSPGDDERMAWADGEAVPEREDFRSLEDDALPWRLAERARGGHLG